MGIRQAGQAATLVEGVAGHQDPVKEARLQRAFSTFPGGWPGTGLLLLRATVGATLLLQGLTYLSDGQSALSVEWLIGSIVLMSGTLLLIGYLTPLAGVLAALSSMGRALSWPALRGGNLFDSRLTITYEVAIAIALVLLGPGAFSLDGRIFGRREIIIPRSPLPPA